jgi:hypothetical protein
MVRMGEERARLENNRRVASKRSNILEDRTNNTLGTATPEVS